MSRRRLPRRTREAMAALWLAEHVFKHIKVRRWVRRHIRMTNPETGEPLRHVNGNFITDTVHEHVWSPCNFYDRLVVWAVITHDREHADHWYWGPHFGCKFDYECPVCHGRACLCDRVDEGPGMKDDDE